MYARVIDTAALRWDSLLAIFPGAIRDEDPVGTRSQGRGAREEEPGTRSQGRGFRREGLSIFAPTDQGRPDGRPTEWRAGFSF